MSAQETLRPFRFGMQTAHVSPSRVRRRQDWVDMVREVDDLGFDVMFVSDHVDDRIGPLAAMASAAQISDRLRLSYLVLDNDFRHPVALAQETASIDILSDGRFELGIGAGWMEKDYTALGMPFDRGGVRVGRLEESLTVLKQAWAGDPFTHDGQYYPSVNVQSPLLKPVQQPHPPIMVGGGGPRMLTIAAQHANIVNVIPQTEPRQIPGQPNHKFDDCTPEAFERKIAKVREVAGDRMPELTLAVNIFSMVLDDGKVQVDEAPTRHQLIVQAMQGTPWAYRGSVASVADQMRMYRERYGISYFIGLNYSKDAMVHVVAELAGS
ncbi:MAG: TIGR03621 family F420-dependent LLM class oxidoreductase [Actinomycetota bacterium]|nr:MAG: TIGR03621 family F420-dependent LLM class oxidoreductase [Actinomycetota bacterium]